MRLLLINPNRSAWITERIAETARPLLREGDTLDMVTSPTGPEVVRSPEQLDAAAREVAALAFVRGDGYDALILGISLDCGLEATRRQQAGQPVIGMTEAACHMACLSGARFGVLTVGAAMAAAYAGHVQWLGFGARCVGVSAPDCAQAFAPGSTGALEIDTDVLFTMRQGVEELRALGADSVVLAGAVLCGYGAALESLCGIRIWEGAACAVSMARALRDCAPPSRTT